MGSTRVRLQLESVVEGKHRCLAASLFVGIQEFCFAGRCQQLAVVGFSDGCGHDEFGIDHIVDSLLQVVLKEPSHSSMSANPTDERTADGYGLSVKLVESQPACSVVLAPLPHCQTGPNRQQKKPSYPAFPFHVYYLPKIVNFFEKSATNGSGPLRTERQLAFGWRSNRPAYCCTQ
jgi:hypothetical protein